MSRSGVLTLPPQDPSVPRGRVGGGDRSGGFRSVDALMDHRPLGEVMRARKVVYYQSQQGRR
jgi:hypothetical protein